jgi:hypothetical protein
MLCVGSQIALQVAGELFGVVPVVVQVQLDFSEAGSGKLCQRFQILGLVLLAGKEEAVARRAAVGVAQAFHERRVQRAPALDAVGAVLQRGVPPQRLVVIAHRDQQVPGTLGGGAGERAQIGLYVAA